MNKINQSYLSSVSQKDVISISQLVKCNAVKSNWIKAILYASFMLLTIPSWAQSADWVTFESEDESFKMSGPSKPKYVTKEIMTSVGTMELHSYMIAPKYEDEDPNLMYLIEYYDYPEGTFPEDSIELKHFFFDQTMQATSYEIGGKLSYSSQSTVDGIDGMLYRCQYKDDTYVMKSRMFFVKDRFYHIKVYTEKATSLNDEMDWYLNSFKRI